LLFSDKIGNFDVENHKLGFISKLTYEKLVNSGYRSVYDSSFIARIVIVIAKIAKIAKTCLF
jgi:hypothetical protein